MNANPFAELVRVATRAAPEPALPPGQSKTRFLLQALRQAGRMSTPELARSAGLTTRQVWGLLRSQRDSGQVRVHGGEWEYEEAFVRPELARAAQLLRGCGWRVEPPAAAEQAGSEPPGH